MTNLPYTHADLHAEAARQPATLTEDPDFMGIGEQMDGHLIPSTDDGLGGMSWDGLPDEHFNDAQRKIDDLIGGAADVSAWAVQLGVDGLQPEDHTLSVDSDGRPLVRLHVAFVLPRARRRGVAVGHARPRPGPHRRPLTP
ncbi:hypothetical protein [Streptomyces sp. NPDC060022]|uniref:hypothetical protein n=1 Tax=Streptomyces sp. NPDC060022 TaxID=3347039 RepID=UPI003675FCB2